MRHALGLAVVAMTFVCWPHLSKATDAPARLVVGENSIEELLRLPESLEAGRYAVHCEAHILRTGHAVRPYCYTMAEPVPANLVRAVIKAAKRARYVPAVRAGEPIEVYVLLMVLIDSTLGEPMILAVPNNGVQRKKFGLLYSSPQRLIRNARRAASRPILRDIPSGRPHLLIWSQFQVDELGNVLDFRLEEIHGARPRAIQLSDYDASNEKFVPGYHEGRPVAMLFVEPIFSP